MILVAIVALLLFGDRLPEVMRSLGQGLVEFKKGMRGIESAMESAATAQPRRPAVVQNDIDDRDEPAAPRFVPPTSEPRLEAPVAESTMAPATAVAQGNTAALADTVALANVAPANSAAQSGTNSPEVAAVATATVEHPSS
jgi:sec-independent protein translocase protein TatA